MKHFFTLLLSIFFLAQSGFSQVFVEQFDNTPASFIGGAASYSTSTAAGEWTINGTNTGAYDAFSYQTNDGATAVVVDATGNNKVFVRAKASSVGTQLRMDVQDEAGFLTSIPGITKSLTTDFLVLEYDFSGVYQDGGYGGTPCTAGPCPVDGSKIKQLVFYINPGQGGFNGSVVVDYISFGEAAGNVITSNIFQDHFTQDSSINSFVYFGQGLSGELTGTTEVVIHGDGTSGPYDPFTYIFRNPVTLTPIDIDVTSGNNKLYVKVKSTVANTAFRIDLQDVNDYLSTQGSLTKIVGTEYTILEYDFSGNYADLGYGGSPCTAATAPCPMDGTRIKDLICFIKPGEGGFFGDLTIDYISFGVSLEPAGPGAELVYEDHFDNATLDYTTPGAGFTAEESGSELKIVGDGSSTPYTSISYILNDRTTGAPVVVDMTNAQNKVFVKAKTLAGTVPLRIDLIDTSGYITSLASLTKTIGPDYTVFTYDFSGNFNDGGYGGSPCAAGPCPVDPKSIKQVLFYIDAALGTYNGTVLIDFISIGLPLEDDPGVPVGLINYQDQLNSNAGNINDPAGLVSTFPGNAWRITGDGTSGQYAQIKYGLHDDAGLPILGNTVGSNDKIYVRAKSSVAGTVFRFDVQDNLTYSNNLFAQTATLTNAYEVYEYNYAGNYADGAYGGSPCTVSGCPVDGERIANLLTYINPGTGLFAGTIDVDWISFGSPITGVNDLQRLGSLVAYPNPATETMFVDFETLETGNVAIQIYNSVGARVQSNDLGLVSAGKFSEKLNLSALTSGLYYAVISIDGANSGSLKFTK
jgi:Secretion system C-terminal sorting domain